VTEGLCTPLPTSGVSCRSIVVVPAVAVIGIRITPLWPVGTSRANRLKNHLVHFTIRLLSTPRTCGRTLPPSVEWPLSSKHKHFLVEGFIVIVFGGSGSQPCGFSNRRIRAAHRILASYLVGTISRRGNRPTAKPTGYGLVFPRPTSHRRTALARQTHVLPPWAREIIPVPNCAFLVLPRTARPTLNPITFTGDPQPLLLTTVASNARRNLRANTGSTGSLLSRLSEVFAGKAAWVFFTFADEVETTGDGVAASSRMMTMMG